MTVAAPEGGFAPGGVSTRVTGTDLIDFSLLCNPEGCSIYHYFVRLTVSEYPVIHTAFAMDVQIPLNSIDINVNATPEPASWLFAGSGLAALILRRRLSAR